MSRLKQLLMILIGSPSFAKTEQRVIELMQENTNAVNDLFPVVQKMESDLRQALKQNRVVNDTGNL